MAAGRAGLSPASPLQNAPCARAGGRAAAPRGCAGVCVQRGLGKHIPPQCLQPPRGLPAPSVSLGMGTSHLTTLRPGRRARAQGRGAAVPPPSAPRTCCGLWGKSHARTKVKTRRGCVAARAAGPCPSRAVLPCLTAARPRAHLAGLVVVFNLAQVSAAGLCDPLPRHQVPHHHRGRADFWKEHEESGELTTGPPTWCSPWGNPFKGQALRKSYYNRVSMVSQQ